MKLGEKLQQLRKKSGLSQEQLAARLTVSRQAVGKWGRRTCHSLLREELDEPDAALVPAVQEPPQPTPPGEAHLDQEGWIHNACVLSLAVCSIGLVSAFMGLIVFHSARARAAVFRGCLNWLLPEWGTSEMPPAWAFTPLCAGWYCRSWSF